MSPGMHNAFYQVSLFLHILLLGFQLWLWKAKKDLGSDLSSGNDGKSPVRRWNLIWTFGHQFLSSKLNIRLKYDLSRAREICRGTNDYLRILSVADFSTLKYSWEMREPPFGETHFLAVELWLAVQVAQSTVPGVGFWCFRSKRAGFRGFESPTFPGVLL